MSPLLELPVPLVLRDLERELLPGHAELAADAVRAQAHVAVQARDLVRARVAQLAVAQGLERHAARRLVEHLARVASERRQAAANKA